MTITRALWVTIKWTAVIAFILWALPVMALAALLMGLGWLITSGL